MTGDGATRSLSHSAADTFFGLATVDGNVIGQRLVSIGERQLPFAACSDVDAFGDAECVLRSDAQIPSRAVHLDVAKQKLNRARVPRLAADHLRGVFCTARNASQRFGSSPSADTHSLTSWAYCLVGKCCGAWNRLANRGSLPSMADGSTHSKTDSRVFTDTSNWTDRPVLLWMTAARSRPAPA